MYADSFYYREINYEHSRYINKDQCEYEYHNQHQENEDEQKQEYHCHP